MKKLTKVLTLLMTVVILISVCVVSFASSTMKVTATDVSAKAGEEITINVNLDDNVGVAILRVTVEYDASVLTLKKCVKGEAAKSFDSSMLSTSDNPVVLSCQMNPPEDEANAEEANNKTNGNLLTFTFTTSSDVKAGAYPITVKVAKCFDINDDKVDCIAESASVVIVEKETTEPTTPPVTTEKETTTNPPVTTEKETTTKPPVTTTENTTTTEKETTTKLVDDNTTTTRPIDNNTTTTEKQTTTTTKKHDGGIPATGDSSVVAVVAGVCILAGTAFVATKKKEE